ncbi:MAG: HAMP domain-containing histidine kinase [Actinobacteria bacterium]|nr:HAMP domain-containing histidine kinase [Actinomycetota bacterium]MCG2802952.1 HAMP domain-containing histidine kinase [Cellulomonas sp.]
MGRRLRTRLTVVTTGLLALALVGGAVTLTWVLSASRVAALDQVVRDRVGVVADLVVAGRVPAALPVAEPGEMVQVLDDAGQVLATSPNASRTLPLLSHDQVTGLVEAADGATVVRTSTDGSYDREVRVAVRAVPSTDGSVVVVATMPLAEVQGLLRALRVALVMVVPACTALFGLAVWLALGRALAPVEQLRAAAAQVVDVGGPGELPVPAHDGELAALARTLNEMLDRLQVASARQRSFVADAAHELRSPLASIRAGVEVAQAHPDSFEAGELAAELGPQVLRMQRLVDDLLLLARVGASPREVTVIDLASLVREVAEALPVVPGGQVTVDGDGSALGDREAVGRVLRNLLDNAARHAASSVRVHVADGVLDVDDDGAGIAAEDRERVFERFVRLDEARERDAGGSGLGLAIARELARESGGDVRLGEAPGGGLRAGLTLPRADSWVSSGSSP